MNFEELVTNYGYAAILIGTFLEGEMILIIAGFLSHRGYLELPYVIAAAFFGTLLGDQLFFHIGRLKGKQFIARRPAWEPKAARVFALLHKHQIWLILGFRFLYGLRTVTPFVLGSSGISPVRFLVLNTIGALVWAIVIACLGYYFGQALELLVGGIKLYEKMVVLILLLTGAVIWAVYKWKEKKNIP